MKKKVQESIQEALQKGWSEFSSALGNFEGEVARQFQRARKVLDPQAARAEVQETLSDLHRRFQASGEQLEREAEERLHSILSRLRDPLAEELAGLRQRAEALSARIESQLHLKRSDGDKPKDPRASGD